MPPSKPSPLTLTELTHFFTTSVDPKFSQLSDELQELRGVTSQIMGQQVDLYKKYEDLHLEYTVIQKQLDRIETKTEHRLGELERHLA